MVGMAFALFALALVVALLWIQVSQLNARLSTLASKSASSTPAMVTAAIEDLRTALAQVNATNRREFGAIWKRLGLSRRAAEEEGETFEAQKVGNTFVTDSDFEAMIALQSAPVVKPQ